VYRLVFSFVTVSAVLGTIAAAQQPLVSASTNSAPIRVLTLGMVLDSVAANYPLAEAARARVRAARGARRAAGTVTNPIFGYDVENAPLPGGAPATMSREVMTTLMLPLEELYQRGPRVRRADAELRAAEADARVASQQILLDAAVAYSHVALGQVSVDASRNVVAWLDTVVTYNRSRVREGVAAEADLIRSEVERDRASADAAIQEAALAQALAELAPFLGDPVEQQPSSIVVAVEDTPLIGPTPPENTREYQPQVQAARERSSAAKAGIAAERSMLVRQIGATVGTKRSDGVSMLVAGVSLPIPLFDQNRGGAERARAENDVAQLELSGEQRRANAALTGATAAARLLTDRLTALAARDTTGGIAYLDRADEGRRIALGAYREGAVPLFQVIDATRAWADARATYYQLVYAQHQSILELLVARGTPLSSTAVSAGTSQGSQPR
jgi:cobalt-zinc-cadmium efflux system outer membrane protein